MHLVTSFKCAICGLPRGKPYDHSKCAREQQRIHKNDKRNKSTTEAERLDRVAEFIVRNGD